MPSWHCKFVLVRCSKRLLTDQSQLLIGLVPLSKLFWVLLEVGSLRTVLWRDSQSLVKVFVVVVDLRFDLHAVICLLKQGLCLAKVVALLQVEIVTEFLQKLLFKHVQRFFSDRRLRIDHQNA